MLRYTLEAIIKLFLPGVQIFVELSIFIFKTL